MEAEKEEDEVEAELRNGINTPTLIILLYILCESSPEKKCTPRPFLFRDVHDCNELKLVALLSLLPFFSYVIHSIYYLCCQKVTDYFRLKKYTW